MLCDPDRIWAIDDDHQFAKMSIEFKTPWALKADNILEDYTTEYEDFISGKLKGKGKVIRSVEQIYTYMSINRQRYRCLTNFDNTWFFKKVETPNIPSASTLLVSPTIACNSNRPYTLLSAWLFIILTIEKNCDWMYASPYSSLVSPSFQHRNSWVKINKCKYKSINFDGLMHWENIIARSQAGGVAIGHFMNQQNVIFKTIDLSKRIDGLIQFNNEVSVYEKLEDLQGICIPRFIAYGNLSGLLQVMVLENVGRQITREECNSRRTEIETILKKFRVGGIVHEDLRLPNIMIDDNNQVRIIDFGMCSTTSNQNTDSHLVFHIDES
jgi:serine/threonine protein kinase